MKKRIFGCIMGLVMLGSALPGLASCRRDGLEVKWGDDVTVFSAITTQSIANTQWGLNKVSKAITEKTKYAFDIEYVTESFSERLGMLMAGGTLPDVILDCDNSTLQRLLAADKVYNLESYIEQYGTNIKKVFSPADLNAIRYEDSKGTKSGIYGLPSSYGEVPVSADWYIQVQYRLLEEFNYPVIKTLDDLGYYIEEYVKKYPKTDGMKNYGVMLPLASGAVTQSVGNTSLRLAGMQDDGDYYIDSTTLEVQYNLTTENTKKYLAWLYDMQEKGLLNPDCFSSEYPDIRTQAANGNVLCVIEPDWQLSEAETALRNAGMDDRRYAKLPIYFDEETAENSHVANYDSRGSWIAVITKDCKNPEEAFKFFDYLWSEEGQIYARWGVEGVNYDVVDGRRVMRQDTIDAYRNDTFFNVNTGIGLYNFWSQGAGCKDSTGQFIDPFTTPEMIAANYTEKDRDVIAVYAQKLGKPDAKLWVDLWAEGKQSPWGFAWKMVLPTSGDYKAAAAVENKLDTGKAAEKIAEVLSAKNKADFETRWSEWVKYAHSDQVDSSCANGITARELQMRDAIVNRLTEWYPLSMADWQNEKFDWLTADITKG